MLRTVSCNIGWPIVNIISTMLVVQQKSMGYIMNKNIVFSFAVASLIATTSLPVFAEQPPVMAEHPMVADVEHRIQNEQKRLDNGLKKGTVTPNEAAADQQELQHISAELAKDQAAHGGHITKEEHRALLRQLNQNSRKIERMKHAGTPVVTAPVGTVVITPSH